MGEELIFALVLVALGLAVTQSLPKLRKEKTSTRLALTVALGIIAWVPLVGPVAWAIYLQSDRSGSTKKAQANRG